MSLGMRATCCHENQHEKLYIFSAASRGSATALFGLLRSVRLQSACWCRRVTVGIVAKTTSKCCNKKNEYLAKKPPKSSLNRQKNYPTSMGKPPWSDVGAEARIWGGGRTPRARRWETLGSMLGPKISKNLEKCHPKNHEKTITKQHGH